MKMNKKLCLALALTGIVGTSVVTAQSGTQNVQATYRNIQVTYNGVNQPMSVEPFLVNGSVYVPLRAVGDIFGANATWVPTTNTVTLTGGSTSNTSSEAELAQLRYEKAVLEKQLSEANTQLAQYKANGSSNTNTGGTTTTTGSNISEAQLKDTEKYLNDTFATTLDSKITMTYALTCSTNQLNVTMSYDSKTANRTFDNLSQSTIQKFMKKIGDNIAATHKDIAIEGVINYTNDDKEKATFTRSKTGSYNFTHAFDSDKLISAVKDETDGTFYFDNLSECSSLSIDDYDIDIRESKEIVNAKIYLDKKDSFKTAWEKLTKNSERENAVSDQLEDIQDAISDLATEYDINVTVYYGPASSSIKLCSIDADGDITTVASLS